LNATGLAQAERLAARLAATPADALFTSDLQRARATAAALERVWGMAAVPVPALREQAFGVLEGLDLPTIQARHPELWADWLVHQADYALPGGESLRDCSERVLAGMRALAAAHAGRHVAVVTHGGVLDVLWRGAQRLALDGRRECAIPNVGINRLRWHGTALEIEVWADDAHVRDLSPAGQA
jgi:probable phosphoglycerate mutase